MLKENFQNMNYLLIENKNLEKKYKELNEKLNNIKLEKLNNLNNELEKEKIKNYDLDNLLF